MLNLLLIPVVIFFGLLFICMMLYIVARIIRMPFLDWIFCKVFPWHSGTYDDVHHAENDPHKFLVFAKCKWCGYEGQIDSQGNLF